MIKTEIRKVENGHQVSFTIGCQTFFLSPQTDDQLEDEEMTTLEYAKWCQRQLNFAFSKLKAENNTGTWKD